METLYHQHPPSGQTAYKNYTYSHKPTVIPKSLNSPSKSPFVAQQTTHFASSRRAHPAKQLRALTNKQHPSLLALYKQCETGSLSRIARSQVLLAKQFRTRPLIRKPRYLPAIYPHHAVPSPLINHHHANQVSLTPPPHSFPDAHRV